MQESKFQFTATDVTGNTFMLTTDIQPELPAGPAAATLAARMQLPDNVPYTLRNESTSVYLDETLLGTVTADAEGLWQLAPDSPVAPGLHRLRVDQVDDSGAVVARVATLFSRAELAGGFPENRYVIVQPGNSLWRIARRTYGEGVRYSVIFQANNDQIADPDLIFPGQIFLVPGTN